jgi:hypothetical protein
VAPAFFVSAAAQRVPAKCDGLEKLKQLLRSLICQTRAVRRGFQLASLFDGVGVARAEDQGVAKPPGIDPLHHVPEGVYVKIKRVACHGDPAWAGQLLGGQVKFALRSPELGGIIANHK